jgi:cell division protein FtsL
MLRMLSIVAAFMTLGAAFALYSLKYDTRRVEIAVQGKERALEKLEADIAILKAERAYLGRPERIEKLARKQGLEPIREQQYVEIGEAMPTDAPVRSDQQKRVPVR